MEDDVAASSASQHALKQGTAIAYLRQG
ncbi:hypothetical protein PIIN_11485 [Serendipita indica DSM 11827]|uniref:Uncharacterized protein n=1 Tax=Serendipita indica (strain DSM 11827) TaxID=1109443 RepID=G4U1R5_SERID|nr:hypothetical protein PIIN_11485 [Serendipita indica DSM 11827]